MYIRRIHSTRDMRKVWISTKEMSLLFSVRKVWSSSLKCPTWNTRTLCSMELMLHHLPGFRMILSILSSSYLHRLKFSIAPCFFLYSKTITLVKCFDVLLLQFSILYGSWRLNGLFLGYFIGIEINLSLTWYKSLHVLLNEWALDNFNYFRSCSFVLCK